MRWEGCTVFEYAAAAALVCEDEDVDFTIVLPEETDRAADSVKSGSIFLLCRDDKGPVAFCGAMEPDGSFRLSSRSRPRTAQLAWSEDRTLLEGSWQQADDSRSLRFELRALAN